MSLLISSLVLAPFLNFVVNVNACPQPSAVGNGWPPQKRADAWLYMLHAKISICTEAELVRYLTSKGYDAEDVLYGLEAQHSLPEAMDRDDYNGLRWGYDALEVGDLVMCFDLGSCVDTMSEVQDSIIERIRAKSK